MELPDILPEDYISCYYRTLYDIRVTRPSNLAKKANEALEMCKAKLEEASKYAKDISEEEIIKEKTEAKLEALKRVIAVEREKYETELQSRQDEGEKSLEELTQEYNKVMKKISALNDIASPNPKKTPAHKKKNNEAQIRSDINNCKQELEETERAIEEEQKAKIQLQKEVKALESKLEKVRWELNCQHECLAVKLRPKSETECSIGFPLSSLKKSISVKDNGDTLSLNVPISLELELNGSTLSAGEKLSPKKVSCIIAYLMTYKEE